MSSDPILAYRNEAFLDSDDSRPLRITSSRCRRFSGSEERDVEKERGDEYRAYRKRVPMFIPRWGQWRAMTTTRDDTPARNA